MINLSQSICFTPAEFKRVDQEMDSQYAVSTIQLMELAGFQAALLCKKLLKDCLGKSVFVAAGKGNNGGDALVVARLLKTWGAQVVINEFNHFGRQYDLIVDGLLGCGLTSPPRPEAQDRILFLQKLGTPILSIDLPSGLNAETGDVYAPCIQATATITFAALKSGFMNPSAQKVLGSLYLADIGISPDLYPRNGDQIKALFSKVSIIPINLSV